LPDLVLGSLKLENKQRPNAVKQATQIRYCLTQAREYFDAARVVSLATKPNLLYYGLMSLALAEILFKQSGDSSLDRARQEHRHHGLLFIENLSKKKSLYNLFEASKQLIALPMEMSGKRIGTFHLWHKTARKSPICGLTSTSYLEGGGTTRTDLILGAVDQPLEPLASSGVTLAECLAALPAMMDFVFSEGMSPAMGRGKIERNIAADKTSETIIVFHPSPVSQSLYENLKIAPEWVNFMDITTYPSGFILRYRLDPMSQRWSRFLRQPVKVDLTTQRTIHHEDAETIFG
jgi:hypothetical protein